jgi:hypothetical protein
VEVPVQFFQSVIAIELATAGALLFQVRFFDRARDDGPLPNPWLSLLVAVILASTVYGSLWAMVHDGTSRAAVSVSIGVALSVVPILLRILPPLAIDLKTGRRDPDFPVAIVALVGYTVLVAVFVVLLHS